jgi:hypothetical protein
MGAGLQLSALCKDGSTFPAEISLSTVTDDQGDLMVLAAVRDIRERIELEAQRQRSALEAQREQSHRLESLGQLAGGVAHDFNNLLGVILNYATLMSRRVVEPTAIADLGEIRAAAERGASLTAQLLTFARRDVLNRESLDVTSVVSSVGSMLKRTLGEHILLRLELGEVPVFATCDRSQLEQIVMNLAINARDAMPEGGVLTIAVQHATEPSEEQFKPAVLTVADTGHGMTSEVAARAFEPFFSTKPRGRGTGLGLATVYGIVGQNEGQITLSSTPGEGTTVTVQLPAAVESAGTWQAETAEANRSRRTAGGHERILLVEDEAPLRVGTARLLEEAGYDVLTASDGVDALEIFDRDSRFDLIVTDLAMPRMRGDELALQLSFRAPALQVIFMTGYDSGGAPLTGRVLAKPVVETHLLQAVRETLDG